MGAPKSVPECLEHPWNPLSVLLRLDTCDVRDLSTCEYQVFGLNSADMMFASAMATAILGAHEPLFEFMNSDTFLLNVIHHYIKHH